MIEPISLNVNDLRSAIMTAITDVWDRTKQIDDATDEVLDLIEADRQATKELLQNPVHVHTNMCRGIIAPITFDQLAHVLGEDATNAWLADRQARGEPVAIVRHYEYSGIARNGFRQEAVMLDGAPALPDGAMLYTTPQPQQIPDGFTEALAQEIRRVDGNHSLGACALAEALIPFLSNAMLEAAPEPMEPT